MTYEIRNGWIIGQLPGPNGSQVRVKHFPQMPYERRRRENPRLCPHTTQTSGYVLNLRFPSEFQVGEDVIGQHRPLWARGAAVDEHDHDLLQIEIVEFSRLDRWLPKPSSLTPLVALLALLHRRDFVATALSRPEPWPIVLDRLPAAVDTYYRRHEVWGRSVRLRSRRDPRGRTLGPGIARLSGVVLDGATSSRRGRWRE